MTDAAGESPARKRLTNRSVSRREFMAVGGKTGLVLAASGSLASTLLAACSSGSEGGSDAVTTIDFFTLGGARFGDVETALAEIYRETNPDVTINVDAIGITEFFPRAAATMTEPGKYDMMTSQLGPTTAAANLGTIQELTPFMSSEFLEDYESDVVEPRRLAGQIDGKYYGVGHDAIAELMYYREDLFEAAGLDVPTTWDEVVEAAAQLDSDEVHALTLPVQRGYYLGLFFHGMIRSYGGDILDADNRPTVASPAGQQALEITKRMLEHADPESINAGEAETAEALRAGTVAFCPVQLADPQLTAAGAHRYVDTMKSTLKPGAPGKDPEPLAAGLLMWMAESAENPEETWKFMEYLVSKEGQLEGVKHTGIPSRLSILRDPDAIEVNPVFETIADSLEYSFLEITVPESGQIYETVGTECHLALLEEASVEQALESTQQALDSIMKDAGYY